MKNILAVLFVLASVCLSGQTKGEALKEMNALIRKVEGASTEKGNVKVVKQVLGKKYRFKIQKGSDILKVKAKNIPWGNYSYCKRGQPDYDSGLVYYSLYFDAEFEISLKYGKTGASGNSSEINIYLKSEDIERFEELLKIVSEK
jgi:hypothetical protein